MRLALAALLFSAGPALAQSTPVLNAWTSPCATVTQAAASKGVAVLRTSARGWAWDYERVVRDASFCFPRQEVYPIWVKSRDNAQCFAGYVCEDLRGGRLH